MSRRLAQIALVVDDYDRAIDFYTKKLGFTLVEDTKISETKRWVVVAPSGNKQNCCILLARAANAAQESRIGNQTGGRVFLFLKTDDFWSDYEKYSENGVEFVGEPRTEDYGTVCVFKDLYGNLWDLIEERNPLHTSRAFSKIPLSGV